jgi:hypothetical protein
VHVPTEVTLVADEGKEMTFIVGAPDMTESGDDYHLGTNALRCVYLSPNSRVKDFTITGGYTWGEAIPDGYVSGDVSNKGNWSGGGIYGDASGIVDGCMVSNNWAYYGGGMRTVTAIRSFIMENHAIEQGGAMRGAKLYGCVVDKNYTGFASDSNPSSCYMYSAIVGSTIGASSYTHDGGDNGVSITSEGASPVFSYNLILGTLGNYKYKDRKIIGCIFARGVGNWKDKFDENVKSIVDAGTSIKLDENYRLMPDSIGVDWVTADALSDATGGKLPVDKDISGFQRVMNGKADIGALEADWRGEYAKLLDGFGNRINVTSATSDVTTNDVNGVSSVALADGESISLEWWNAEPFARRNGMVSVTGEGTLAVMRNGAVFAEYNSSSSPAQFFIPAVGGDQFAFTFSFKGEGSADIYNFAAVKGTLFTIR